MHTTNMLTPAEQLLLEIENSEAWPLAREMELRDDIEFSRELAEADVDSLRSRHSPTWTRETYVPAGLYKQMLECMVSLVWSERFTILAGKEEDQDLMDLIVKRNDLYRKVLDSDFNRYQDGETWARWKVDPEIDDVPILEWSDRTEVLPRYRSGRLTAVAFITPITRHAKHQGDEQVVRIAEVHERARVIYAAFVGDADLVGDRVDLSDVPEADGLPAGGEWNHGIPAIIAYCIRHRERRDRMAGKPLCMGHEQGFLNLNRQNSFAAIAAEAAKKTIVYDTSLEGRPELVPADPEDPMGPKVMKPSTGLDWTQDAIAVHGGLGLSDKVNSPIQEITIGFDADVRANYVTRLRHDLCSDVGMSHQLIESDGAALSGAAIRSRHLNTWNLANRNGSDWDAVMPTIMRHGALLDSNKSLGELPAFGRKWSNPAAQPTFNRGAVLPEDEVESANATRLRRGAGVKSRYRAISEENTTWTDNQIEEEIDRIYEEDVRFEAIKQAKEAAGQVQDPDAPDPATEVADG